MQLEVFILCMCVCVCSRDLIKVLKWYVDRIVDAEHQDHIQQVLKVRPPHEDSRARPRTNSPAFTHIRRYTVQKYKIISLYQK